MNHIFSLLPLFNLLSVIGAYFAYLAMPDTIPIHWNAFGQADGFGPKYYSLVFAALPILGYTSMNLFRAIDPIQKIQSKSCNAFRALQLYLTLAFTAIYWISAAAALGYVDIVGIGTPLILGALFASLATVLPDLPHNHFIGIRTPWTIHDEIVWKIVHKKTKPLFIGCGIAFASARFFPGSIQSVILLGSIVIMACWPTWLSYTVYKEVQEEKKIQSDPTNKPDNND